MYGYIYKTTNLITNKIYIGQHKSEKFDKDYYGSGILIQRSLKKYSKKNHNVEILVTAESKEELDSLEKEYIKYFKENSKEDCMNIANGGEGGNVWEYANEEKYNDFCSRMQKINSERCSTEDFKNNCSKNMTKRYSNPDEREKQSKIVRKSWENELLRKQQSDRIKNFYKGKKRDCSFNNIPYMMELNNKKMYFNSRKELDIFLHDNYNGFTLPRGNRCKIKLDGSNEFYTKNKKYSELNGMRIYKNYKFIEDVETNE